MTQRRGDTRCAATTKKGAPCAMARLSDSAFCFAHAPEREAERRAASRRGGEAGSAQARYRASGGDTGRDTGDDDTTDGESVAIGDVAGVQALLGRAIRETMALELSNNRSRSLGYLLSIALKALETGNLRTRLEEIEALLAQQGGHHIGRSG